MEKQVIEYGGQPVGIVIPEQDALKFIAVKFHVMDLDSKIFRSPREVRDAIRQHLTAHPTSVGMAGINYY